MADWTQITVPRVRTVNMSLLGQKGDQAQLTEEERATQARLSRHGACIAHEKVSWCRLPVCVTKGQSRLAVVADTVELDHQPEGQRVHVWLRES